MTGGDERDDRLAERTLAEAVRRSAGLANVAPRPGQVQLLQDVAATLGEPGARLIGQAPTGVGKTLAYLVPAALRAALDGERTVVSTESKSLQAQIVDKDAPVVAASVEAVTGARVEVAVLKGWSNTACALAMAEAAGEFLGAEQAVHDAAGMAVLADRLRDAVAALPVTGRLPWKQDPLVEARRVTGSLLAWAAAQHTDGNSGAGDRYAYEGAMTEADWALVSTTPADCLGPATCPLAGVCLPRRARDRAAAAHVVVTNHAMLAVQAAKGVPVVLGNATLGRFDHVVVDEAHQLPAQVRAQGACSVNAGRVLRLAATLRALLGDTPAASDLTVAANVLAERLEQILAAVRARPGAGEVVPLGGDDQPLTGVRDQAAGFVSGALRAARAARDDAERGMSAAAGRGDRAVQTGYAKTARRARKVVGALESFSADLDMVATHTVSVARWVGETTASKGRVWSSLEATPVNVAAAIDSHLWHVTDPATQADPEVEGAGQPRPVSVVAVSATIPASFGRDAGLPGVRARGYESPFDAAYAGSMLFVPHADTPEDLRALAPDTWSGPRPRFDTRAHQDWAARHACTLVEANRGAALVLSATTAGGRVYAARLREHAAGRWRVLSQWDGEPVRVLLERWKADPSAVMVGTRSLMTGVDAKGATCSLVVVDRPPRSGGNPVDDARVRVLAECAGMDRWAADRLVYVADAALLLEQAAGRLIRSVQDRGMVAVLDPRLAGSGRLSYPKQVRDMYLSAVSRFEARTNDTRVAVGFLAGSRKRGAEAA